MPSIKYKKKTYAGATFPVLEMTKAEYDALPEEKKMDGTVYMITDDTGGWEAENASYDNTESGLTATNVQSALDELNSKTSQTPTVPAYVELLQNQSAVYPNGQKLLQAQLHFTSAVSANWAILGIPTALRSSKYVAVSVINSNTGDVYGAIINNDLLMLMKAAPAGWYVISVMYV